jgi:hypothetical protein
VGRYAEFAHPSRPLERWEQTGTEQLDPGDGSPVIDVAVFTVSYTGKAPRPVDPDNDPPAGADVVHTYTKRMPLDSYTRLSVAMDRGGYTTTEGDV